MDFYFDIFSALVLQYILGCKSLEALSISKSTQLSAATLLKIPGSLISLKSLVLDEVASVDSNTLQTLFSSPTLRLNEFGLTERSKICLSLLFHQFIFRYV